MPHHRRRPEDAGNDGRSGAIDRLGAAADPPRNPEPRHPPARVGRRAAHDRGQQPGVFRWRRDPGAIHDRRRQHLAAARLGQPAIRHRERGFARRGCRRAVAAPVGARHHRSYPARADRAPRGRHPAQHARRGCQRVPRRPQRDRATRLAADRAALGTRPASLRLPDLRARPLHALPVATRSALPAAHHPPRTCWPTAA